MEGGGRFIWTCSEKPFFFGTKPYNSETQVVGEHAECLGIGINISSYRIVLCMNRTMFMNEVYPQICTCNSKYLSNITTGKKNQHPTKSLEKKNSISYNIGFNQKKFRNLKKHHHHHHHHQRN
jgi:hypothetical protein